MRIARRTFLACQTNPAEARADLTAFVVDPLTALRTSSRTR
jgi:hypothetical protein